MKFYFLPIIAISIFILNSCDEPTSTTSEDDKSLVSTSGENEIKEQLKFPIGFNINSPEAFNTSRLTWLKSEWIPKLEDSSLELIVTGNYYKNEENNTRSRNLGIARAAEIKELLSVDIPENRIQISSAFIDEDFNKNWIEAYSLSVKAVQSEKLIGIETPEMFIIYYPSGNSTEVLNESVSASLAKIAEEMKLNSLGANIICHTDKSSSTKSDYKNGQKRAEAIKDYLFSLGVDAAELRASSMGSSQPKENNTLNRRIEIIFSSNR